MRSGEDSTGGDWRRVFLLVLALKLYALGVLYLVFLTSPARPQIEESFLFLEPGEKRSDRVEEIEADPLTSLKTLAGRRFRSAAGSSGFRVSVSVSGSSLASFGVYERVVTMDADLSHAPEEVPRLLGALDRADVAIGSRYVRGGATRGWPLRRRLLSRLGGAYARLLLRIPARDVTSGFRAYRRSALENLDSERDIRSSGFIFQVEVLRRLLDAPGTRVLEVPILFRNRTRGSSKISAGVVLEGVLGVAALALRSRRHGPGDIDRAKPGSEGLQRQRQATSEKTHSRDERREPCVDVFSPPSSSPRPASGSGASSPLRPRP